MKIQICPLDRTTGIVCDQTVKFDNFRSEKKYPDSLRRIRFKAPATGKTLVFLTNDMTLPATAKEVR